MAAADTDSGQRPRFDPRLWSLLFGNFVIGSGILHTVRDFVEAAFSTVGLDWRPHVLENPNSLQRKTPAGSLLADTSKLRSSTDWRPQVNFRQMVEIMIKAESDCL